MSTILNNDLIMESPEEAFTYDVLDFSRSYDVEVFRRIYGFVSKNFEKIHGKLCWKKYHYIAVSKMSHVERWLTDKNHYESTPPRIIIASELLDNDNKARWQIKCRVFKAIGNRGKKERRGQWYDDNRTNQNPILSSGYEFRNYDIFMIPENVIEMLYTYLPHQSNE